MFAEIEQPDRQMPAFIEGGALRRRGQQSDDELQSDQDRGQPPAKRRGRPGDSRARRAEPPTGQSGDGFAGTRVASRRPGWRADGDEVEGSDMLRNDFPDGARSHGRISDRRQIRRPSW